MRGTVWSYAGSSRAPSRSPRRSADRCAGTPRSLLRSYVPTLPNGLQIHVIAEYDDGALDPAKREVVPVVYGPNSYLRGCVLPSDAKARPSRRRSLRHPAGRILPAGDLQRRRPFSDLPNAGENWKNLTAPVWARRYLS